MAKKIYIHPEDKEKAKQALIRADIEFAISKKDSSNRSDKNRFGKIVVRNVVADDALKTLENASIRISNDKSRKTGKYLLRNQRHYELFCLTNEYYEKRTNSKEKKGQ